MHGRALAELDKDECIKLMERHPIGVGRVATGGKHPTIFPVNYAVDDGAIVFRTDPGTKLHAALLGSDVAFEVDWVEPTWQLGWSVVAKGPADLITDPLEQRRASRLPLVPWAEGKKEHFIKIVPDEVSGRKLQ